MANKVTRGILAKYPSTALTFKLINQSGSLAATYSATTTSTGAFSFTVTEAISGWHAVVAMEGSSFRGQSARGVFYPGDVAGTYYVDDPNEPAVFAPVYRSADDTNPILFMWPISGDTITATRILTENGTTGSSASVAGAITATGRSASGQFEYSLAYNSADRPSGEGVAQYVLTGTGYVGYLTLEVSPSVANLSLITPEGVVYLEGATTNIKLKIGSTKEKTHYTEAGTNLTGKTLKLYIETKPGVFFEEINVTGGASGAFTFTPSSTLTASVHNYPAALREPSDGNNVLWHGLIEVGYAADGA